MTPCKFRWGLLFIMAGVVALLAKADVLTVSVPSFIVTFFPFFLIAVGIEKIFTRSRYEVIAYAAPVLLVLTGFAIAMTGDRLSFDAGFVESRTITEPFDPKVTFVNAAVDLGEGDLTIRDATDDLFDGRFREFSPKPTYTLTRAGDSARIDLTDVNGKIWGGLVRIDTDEPDDWHLAFSRQTPLALECDGHESEIHLNLATTPLKALRVRAANSDIYVKLGKLIPDVNVSVTGLDSQLRLRVPSTSGLRVTGLNDATYLYEIGLIQRDSVFVTSGFDTLSTHIDVNLDDRFRSLSIDFY